MESENTILIEKEKLNKLLAKLDEAETERVILKEAAVNIMSLMGLIDPKTGKMKAEIASGEESFVPGMLKSLSDVVALLTQSSMPKFMGGNKAAEKLESKFSFIKKLLPIINKHAN